MSSEMLLEEEPVEVVFTADIDESSEEPPREEWTSLLFEIPEENVKRLQYAEGLYEPGSGEICTKYLALSASSVYRHPYYKYPAVVDPGINEALFHAYPKIIYPDDGQEHYLALCKEANIGPMRTFYRQLLEESVDLKFYGIHSKGFRPIAIALKLNRHVKYVDLTDNWIDVDGSFHLGEMLAENITITELNLEGCRIGIRGAKRLFLNLHLNRSLKKLNLSKNELEDEGVELFAQAIFRGIDVVDVNFSHNRLTGLALMSLYEAFETHNRLTHIDLSWNNITSPNSVYSFCQRLSENLAFKELKLAWNALCGARVANGIKVLMKNPSVRLIDLSNNRFSGMGPIKSLGVNLAKAKGLQILNLSYNPLTPDEALNILSRLSERVVKLQTLLLDGVFVTEEFLRTRKNILSLKFRKNTVITWGGVRPEFIPVPKDIRMIMLKRANKLCNAVKKNPPDFPLIILELYKLNGPILGVKDFVRAMRARGAPIDNDLLDGFFGAFAGPKLEKTASVNLAYMIDYVKRLWPDAKLPPTPPPEPEPEPVKKGKKKKK